MRELAWFSNLKLNLHLRKLFVVNCLTLKKQEKTLVICCAQYKLVVIAKTQSATLNLTEKVNF